MSLMSMPFVGTGFDTALHVVAAVVTIGTLGASLWGFWKLHELPIHKAHTTGHNQVGLVTALTWVGFVWHWVWVLAIIVAFVDGDKLICRVRDLWKAEPKELKEEKIPASEVTE